MRVLKLMCALPELMFLLRCSDSGVAECLQLFESPKLRCQGQCKCLNNALNFESYVLRFLPVASNISSTYLFCRRRVKSCTTMGMLSAVHRAIPSYIKSSVDSTYDE
jgi:hypothetical protein